MYIIIYVANVLVAILSEHSYRVKKGEDAVKMQLCHLFSPLDLLLPLSCIWRIQRMVVSGIE